MVYNMKVKSPLSMHILSTISTKNIERLLEMQAFVAMVDKAIDSVGAKNLGKVTYKFPGAGYTLAVCLAESHLAVHTWPELGKVTLDVYLCNFQHDNSEKCERLYKLIEEYFEPQSTNVTRVLR